MANILLKHSELLQTKGILVALCMLIFIPAIGQDFSGKSIKIPPLKRPGVSKKVATPTIEDDLDIETPNLFKPKPKPKKIEELTNAQNQFSKPNDFVAPGIAYMQKLNPDKVVQEDTKVFRRHQFLGEMRTKSPILKIVCRDHMYVDGDVVRFRVNSKVVVPEIILTGDGQVFELQLQTGFNNIEFEALNQGSSGPNTAEFLLFDQKGTLVSEKQWDLATGFKANMVVIKE